MWSSISFPLNYLRGMLCSCQTDLLRSATLSLFMVPNNFVAARLYRGKEMGTLYQNSQSNPHPHLWILSLNHSLLNPQTRVPVFGERLSLLKLHSLKHCGFVFESSLYLCGFRLLGTKFSYTSFLGWAILYLLLWGNRLSIVYCRCRPITLAVMIEKYSASSDRYGSH